MEDGAAGDHLGIEHGFFCEKPCEISEVTIGDVNHGGDADSLHDTKTLLYVIHGVNVFLHGMLPRFLPVSERKDSFGDNLFIIHSTESGLKGSS